MNTATAKHTTVTAMEARKRFGDIMNRAALMGETFTISRAGKPLVYVVPATSDPFEHPFSFFNEWNDPSNDVYDDL